MYSFNLSIIDKLICLSMGQSCSCNDKWSEMVIKLRNSAEKRSKRRRGCKCVSRRPKCLRIRRKTHYKKCTCPSNSTEVKIPLNIDTIACCTPRPHNHSKCTKIQPKPRVTMCSRGTNTCCLQMYEKGVHGVNDGKHACCPVEKIGKNICRFTVDAYFM